MARAWRGYVGQVDAFVLHGQTRAAVLLTVLGVGGLTTVLLADPPGWRTAAPSLALLGTGLAFSALLHRATRPGAASPGRVAALNLVDTSFIAAWLALLSLRAAHPTDCILALMVLACCVVWGISTPLGAPMLLAAGVWPAVAQLLGRPDPLHTVLALMAPAFYAVPAAAQASRRRAAAERQAAAAERQAAADRALAEAAPLVTLGRVEAGVAHDMAEPLAAIRGFAQRLDRLDLGPAREEVRQIAAASEHLGRLVERIRTLASPRPTPPVPLSLETVLDDALLLLGAQLEHRGIRVLREAPAAPVPEVLGDRARLGQVLVNLLANARDALSDLPPGAPRVIRLGLEPGAGTLDLVVSDSGPGVAPELRERIFEPFFTTRAPAGTGLGLAVARELVEAHGGTLSLEPATGGGAAFRIRLPSPAQRPTAGSPQGGAPRAPGTRSG